nr:MAG TPA: hypothetical protein [Caudoviricetes sp.]
MPLFWSISNRMFLVSPSPWRSRGREFFLRYHINISCNF